MKEDFNQNDKLTVETIKSIFYSANYYYQKEYDKNYPYNYQNGSFLFSEDLNTLEKILQRLSRLKGIYYEKRTWNNCSTFSYIDVNRWCRLLNLIEENTKYYSYVGNTITSNKTFAIKQLTPKEKEDRYCGLYRSGEGDEL